MTIEHFDVLIVGAGLSGIGAGVHLQQVVPLPNETWDLFVAPPGGKAPFVTSNQCQGCHSAAIAPFGPTMSAVEGNNGTTCAVHQSWSPWGSGASGRNGFYDGIPTPITVHHWRASRHCRRGAVRCRSLAPRRVGRCSTESDVIEPDDIMATLEAQGSPIEQGDVLLMRTGWTEWYESSTDEAKRAEIADRSRLKAPGLPSGERTAEFLWDMHIAAIGADNPGVEVWPQGTGRDPAEVAELRANHPELMHEVFAHSLLLPMLGIPLGEMFDLSALAADCATDGRYACLFVSAPLNVPHGVATPPNALAIK